MSTDDGASSELTPEARERLDEQLEIIRRSPEQISTMFPAAARSVARGPGDPADAGGVHRPRMEDRARVELLTTWAATRSDAAAVADEVRQLYRFGDTDEKRAVLRALPLLNIAPEDGLVLVADALRANDTRLIAAGMGEYAAQNLDADSWRQGVLKCLFVGVPLSIVVGLDQRADDELARTVMDYARERIAAGRDVPADLWFVLEGFPEHTSLGLAAEQTPQWTSGSATACGYVHRSRAGSPVGTRRRRCAPSWTGLLAARGPQTRLRPWRGEYETSSWSTRRTCCPRKPKEYITMSRPITLFTGQWADLPFEEVARLAGEWGYDGLEVACWGDHLDVWRAAEDDAYVRSRHDILEKNGLSVWAISNHLKGQAVCDDPIDIRPQDILPAWIWGDGDPEGVRQRAAEEMKVTAHAARRMGVDTVVGFTGSAIWKYVAMFPPVREEVIEAGYRDFADRWNPIMDVFDEQGVRFAHEVHPSEIAYDYWTTVKALEAIGHRTAFGLNWDPSHFVWQDLDPAGFLWDFRERIYHVDCKDTKKNLGNGRNGRLGSHLPWADPRRGWDFVSTGHGDVPWEQCFRMLNTIGYEGPISVEWEDAGMERLHGAREAREFVAAQLFDPPSSTFDSAFSSDT
ncbi:MAG TPA: EboA domain-containing protein [Jiangellaceae bacterium]|nr:EboA domain-containing protein [Jiangellaceae bacterium]